MKKLFVSLSILGVVAAGCGDDAEPVDFGGDPSGTTVTLMTHDSFWISDSVWESFTAQTGVQIEVLQVGDAGTMVSEAILTRDAPLADVMFGIDNTFLQRGLDADLFVPYESTNLAGVPAALQLDDADRVTPISFGDVCINYWIDALPEGMDAPTSLEDLTDPGFAGELVVQSPETSSPGLAFLLATIAGTDDWERYWADLVANDVAVSAGWEDAYYGEFTAGGGDRSIVVSYASSPPAEVIFADPPVDTAPTGVLLDSCFRQIEFAGVLRGTERPDAARALVDFLASADFQRHVANDLYVFPVDPSVELDPVFTEFAVVPDAPVVADPVVVDASRADWLERWANVVGR